MFYLMVLLIRGRINFELLGCALTAKAREALD